MPLPRSSGSWLAAATGAEGDTLRLDAERRQNCDYDSDAAGDQRQRQAIVATEMRGDAGLDRSIRRRQQIAELVDQAGERTAGLVRRQLVEMHGDYTPGALHHELHEEGTHRQQHRAVGERPQRQNGEREESGNYDHAAPTDALRERAAEIAAEDGA